MNKKFIYVLLLSLTMNASNAFAVFDFMGTVQTILEKAQNVMTQVQEVQKKAEDIEKKAKQGFDMAKGAMDCVSNPSASSCGGVLDGLDTAFGTVKNIKETHFVGNESSTGDLFRTEVDKLEESIRETIYQTGVEDAFNALRKNRMANNAVVADELALLFAKGVVARQMILQEDGTMYKDEFTEGNLEEILNAQRSVRVLSDFRLAQILEMRAYMISAQATAELTLQNREADNEN